MWERGAGQGAVMTPKRQRAIAKRLKRKPAREQRKTRERKEHNRRVRTDQRVGGGVAIGQDLVIPNLIRAPKSSVDVPARAWLGNLPAVEASTEDLAARTHQRFFAKTKLSDSPRPGMETPCLEWMAFRNRDGYGLFQLDKKKVRSHRLAWELERGSIPMGMCVCHRCDNRGCVRIEHLFLGTNEENTADRNAKGRQSRGDFHYSRVRPERMARGEARGVGKLTEDNVCSILELHNQGCTGRKLAREFHVSKSMISAIITRKKWSHVPLE
jgi:hypothetical protein